MWTEKDPAVCGYDFYNGTKVDYDTNGTYSTFVYRDAVKMGLFFNLIFQLGNSAKTF